MMEYSAFNNHLTTSLFLPFFIFELGLGGSSFLSSEDNDIELLWLFYLHSLSSLRRELS